jgi:hypothetical protein
MVANNAFIMVGLGLAGLWFMNRQRGSQEDQVGQLTGASMMAAGEGTAPDAPFQTYSAPANPIFFFNQGGQMTKVPGTNVPVRASSDEDIGIYPGGGYKPELEFQIAKSIPPAGTSDDSPTTPEFAGTAPVSVTASTIWDQQALIAEANFMPLLAIQDVQGISILQSNVDIATLTSTDKFRAINVGTGGVFTTTGAVLGEYTAGWQAARAAAPATPYVPQTWQQIEAASGLTSRQATSASWIERQEWDLDIGI